MTIHVNRTRNQPPMSLMVVGKCRSANATNPKRGYQEPSTVNALIFYHKVGYYVRPNKVALKYPNFERGDDPNVHVKVFNFVVSKSKYTDF